MFYVGFENAWIWLCLFSLFADCESTVQYPAAIRVTIDSSIWRHLVSCRDRELDITVLQLGTALRDRERLHWDGTQPSET